jgi:Bacterial regulatory protein, Fis family
LRGKKAKRDNTSTRKAAPLSKVENPATNPIREVSDKCLAVALSNSGGVKTEAAFKLGLSTRTVGERVKASPALQRVIAKAIDKNADANIARAMRNGDPRITRWHKECADRRYRSFQDKETEIPKKPEWSPEGEKVLMEIGRRLYGGEPPLSGECTKYWQDAQRLLGVNPGPSKLGVPTRSKAAIDRVNVLEELGDDIIASAVRNGDLAMTRWYKARMDRQYQRRPVREAQRVLVEDELDTCMRQALISELLALVQANARSGKPPLFARS